MEKEDTVKCEGDHQAREIQGFCKECSSVICPKCATVLHQGHDIILLSELNEQEMKMFGELFSDNLFTGASALKVIEKVNSRTKNVIKGISKAIAKTNKRHFLKRLSTEFEKRDLAEDFKEIIICSKRKGEKPYKDEMGRVTYFKIRLGGQDIPLY